MHLNNSNLFTYCTNFFSVNELISSRIVCKYWKKISEEKLKYISFPHKFFEKDFSPQERKKIVRYWSQFQVSYSNFLKLAIWEHQEARSIIDTFKINHFEIDFKEYEWIKNLNEEQTAVLKQFFGYWTKFEISYSNLLRMAVWSFESTRNLIDKITINQIDFLESEYEWIQTLDPDQLACIQNFIKYLLRRNFVHDSLFVLGMLINKKSLKILNGYKSPIIEYYSCSPGQWGNLIFLIKAHLDFMYSQEEREIFKEFKGQLAWIFEIASRYLAKPKEDFERKDRLDVSALEKILENKQLFDLFSEPLEIAELEKWIKKFSSNRFAHPIYVLLTHFNTMALEQNKHDISQKIHHLLLKYDLICENEDVYYHSLIQNHIEEKNDAQVLVEMINPEKKGILSNIVKNCLEKLISERNWKKAERLIIFFDSNNREAVLRQINQFQKCWETLNVIINKVS